MSIKISYESPFKLKNVKRIKQFLTNIALQEHFSIKSLSIVYTSDDFLLEMNRNYLKHDYYTDIITFDLGTDLESRHLDGELYISIDRATDNAVTFSVNIQHEVLRLMIHGLLHLCGHHDATKSQKESMTEKENYYLSQF